MNPRGNFIRHWKQSVSGLGLVGCLLATLAGSGISRAETTGAGAQIPSLKPNLHGVVLAAEGGPISNATVTIKGVLAGRGAVYVPDGPDCQRQATTKADGTFAFDGLAAVTKFEGVVVAPGYQTASFRDADPATGPLEIRIRPLPGGDDPLRTVSGRVVNAMGAPVEEAKIQVHTIHTTQGWHSGGGLVFTDGQGRFVFRASEVIIDCDFRIEAIGYVPRGFSEIHSGANTNEYRLSRGASLTGRLMKDGKPVPDAGIGIYRLAGANYDNSFAAVTDKNGRFTLSGIPPREEFFVFGMMRSLRETGALPRQRVATGDEGARLDLGDLHLVTSFTISGMVRMADGKPAHVAALTLVRTEFTRKADHSTTAPENSSRSFDGQEHFFDSWRGDPGKDGRFAFTGVPGETISICLMLHPYDMASPRNISSDGRGFRLLGMVVGDKTDLVIELDPHSGQIFPPARDYQELSRRPLQGAEAAMAK